MVSRGSPMIHPAIVAGTVGVTLFRCAGPKWDGVDPVQILRKQAHASAKVWSGL